MVWDNVAQPITREESGISIPTIWDTKYIGDT